MKKLLQLKKRGSAIPLAVVAVVILLSMGMGLLRLGLNSRIFSTRIASDIAARCAADAGLAKALFEMNEKLKVKLWDDSTLPQATNETLPNSDATFSYTVTVDSNGVYSISSVGQAGQTKRQVTSTLQLKGFFEYGFFGRDDMIIRSGSVVDWYNHDPGEDNFQMGTASTLPGSILIESGATVNSDVVVGAGGDPGVVINSAGATITGDTYAMAESPELPSVTVPAWLQALPSQGSITGSITLTGSVKYDNIAIQTGDVITIDGPVILYVTGTAWLAEDKPPVFGTPMSEKGRFVINDANPDASLTMYVGGKFRVDAIVNNTFDPRRVTMYGLDSCPEWEIRTDGVFYGTVYAPNTVVELKSSVDVFGSIVAGSLVQKERGNLNFDASLRYASFDIEDLRLEFQPESYSEPSL